MRTPRAHHTHHAHRAGLQLAFMLSQFVISGCATRGLRYASLPVDPKWELLYVRNDGELRVDRGDEAGGTPVLRATAHILLPRSSPDGKRWSPVCRAAGMYLSSQPRDAQAAPLTTIGTS